MKNRFDLEQEICQVHTFADHLGTICEGILEHELTTDEIVNALEGLRVLLNLQANKLHDTMCQSLGLDNYSTFGTNNKDNVV